MRLHHLEVTAFGPFAGTAEVDFDELSAGGVFLLTGATGAGKTSVLDAVCFALYGQVPGDRAGARHLRSDHAASTAAPQVVLRVSIGARTFRFTRSAAWSRPKQRGSGETRVPAHVLVEEARDGAWVALTNRLDDAGLLVGELLGMTATQFTQVAMLPQGRFQAFLRASSTERHAVLQRLFRTDRFERVERWLVDRRGSARRASDGAAQQLREVLSRIQEVAEADLPEGWSDDLGAAADRDQVAPWSAALTATAESHRAHAAQELSCTQVALADADEALAETRALHERRERAEAAARELVALEARGDELAAGRERLAAHGRAAPLTVLVEGATRSRRLVGEAALRWGACRREVADLPEEPTREHLGALLQHAVAARATAEAFWPRARELDQMRSREEAARVRAATLSRAVAKLDAAIGTHPEVLAVAGVELEQARTAAATLVAAEREAATLEELVAADRRMTAVAEELATARADLARAKDEALAAKETYLGVREARINGMAAELAGALAVGCACPVCGSATHPAPAHDGGVVVGRAQEEAARKVHEDAAFVQQGHEVRVATLTTEECALAARLAGVDRAVLTARLATAREELVATRALAATCDSRAAHLQELQSRAEAAREERDRTQLTLTAVRQELAGLETAAATLATELDALLDGEAPDLEALVGLRTERCAELDRAIQAFTAYDTAERSAAEAERSLRAAAEAAGFGDPGQATDALLHEDHRQEIEAMLTAAEAARITAEQVLADPATRAAVSEDAPDLDVAVVKQRMAADAVRSAGSALDAAAARSQRLVALDEQVRSLLAAWAPLREQHALLAGLSQLVEGKGPDNPLRIRLAAYVLSERLRQVVAAANERLATMTGQRYALEHSDDRGAGEQRGGLSLRVRDDWSGVARDPATLSGGETFVVSLALALGLADTVAHEAGGTDIDTLFIDEGFGSLDPDTLEGVMDTLDTLRDGGRVVGLVSHVPELRSRITTQLEVVKGRNGSTLRPVLAGG